MVITILVGPLPDQASCDVVRKSSADGLREGCPQCTVNYSRCFALADLHNTYRNILDQYRVAFPYVVAKETRTIFSDGPLNILLRMCEETAATLREDTDPNAFCMPVSG